MTSSELLAALRRLDVTLAKAPWVPDIDTNEWTGKWYTNDERTGYETAGPIGSTNTITGVGVIEGAALAELRNLVPELIEALRKVKT